MDELPKVTRVRHELRRRRLTVMRVEGLTPAMQRVVLGGKELERFTSLGFDDHVKLFFPTSEESSGNGAPPSSAVGERLEPALVMRDFTPRRFDPIAGELWIDFYLHGAGSAASWAKQVSLGQELLVGGPRGSSTIATEGIDMHLLIGDETALPAIGRRLEELPDVARAMVVMECDDASRGYPLRSNAKFERIEVCRAHGGEPASEEMVRTLRELKFPTKQCFAWAAAESQSARAIRRYLINERGFDKNWIKAAGYWQRGAIASHEVIQDES